MTQPPAAPAAAAPTLDEAPAAATARTTTAEDLLAFEWVADPQMSPDGARVVFTRVRIDPEADEYRSALWLVETATGAARKLTSGERDSQARWSPDGRRLAFVRASEPKKPGQVYVLPLDGGEAFAITKLEGGAADPAWSPDGRRIAFASGHNPALDLPDREKPKNEPARVVTRPVFRENGEGFIDFEHRVHVWVVDVEGGEPRALTTGTFAEGAARWSRDGRRVLFVSDRREEPWFEHDAAVLYTVDPELAEPTDGPALQPVIEFRGVVGRWAEAPDGRIVFVGGAAPPSPRSYDQPTLMLATAPWPCRSPRDLTAALDAPVGEGISSDQHPPRGGGETPLAWTSDGQAAIVLIAREGQSFLVRVDVASGAVTELTPPGLDIVSGTASADGRHWALAIGGLRTPGDLYRFDATTRELRKLVGPNDATLEAIRLSEIEEFWYDSFDGQRIQGWIVKPPDFDPAKRWPMILQIHGGPHTAYGVGFFHEFHHLAGAGYVVVYTNPRGSTSYGQEFAGVIQYRYPGDDAKDLLAAVDVVVARGYVDPARIGVTGGSGGGLLTNWLVTITDRFAAAVTQRCVSEWATMIYSCDFAMFAPVWFRGAPFVEFEDYRARSPVTFADKITTPLMVIHSEDDWRTPIAQGEAMFRALKQQRKPTVMVRFPGENHELSRSGTPSRRVQNQRHIRAWFDRWLLGKPAPEYGV